MALTREQRVLGHVTKDQKGIEVGAWFSPLAPRRLGYDCLVLDVFDGPTLRDRAQADPAVPKDKIPFIEDVDLLGSSSEIADLVAARNALGTFDYIVSSHNFEHQPNPIKFLQGCGQVLRPGGLLSMAIPDRRMCFDHHKPNSRLSDWLQAYFENRRQPTLAQEFDHVAGHATGAIGTRWEMATNLREAFDTWQARQALPERPYFDAHCWTFTPLSFEILVLEAYHLGLSPFQPLHVHPTWGIEFYVELTNTGLRDTTDTRGDAAFLQRRQQLYEALSAQPNVEPPKKKRFWKAWKVRKKAA